MISARYTALCKPDIRSFDAEALKIQFTIPMLSEVGLKSTLKTVKKMEASSVASPGSPTAINVPPSLK
jgi:hypothetical protein